MSSGRGRDGFRIVKKENELCVFYASDDDGDGDDDDNDDDDNDDTDDQSHPFSLIMWASSIMYFPSLYFWLDSNACSC